MNSTPAVILLAILALCPIAPARAQETPKQRLAVGHALAVDLCSACHATPGQAQPRSEGARAPSFAEIANRPDTSAASLRAFMTSTHTEEHRIAMNSSNAMLTLDQKDKVIEYILSLRGGR